MARKKSAREASDEECKQALWRARGIVSAAAQNLGIARETLSRRINESPELDQARQTADLEYKGTLVDMAKTNLFNSLKGGSLRASQWVLETLAKQEGFVKRNEFTGEDGGPIQFEDAAADFDARMARKYAAARSGEVHEEPDEGGEG